MMIVARMKMNFVQDVPAAAVALFEKVSAKAAPERKVKGDSLSLGELLYRVVVGCEGVSS